MLTDDGKAMLVKSVRSYLKGHPGRTAEAKKFALRRFLDYRKAFGGGEASKELVKEIEKYVDKIVKG